MISKETDKFFMERALTLARMGERGASPNPMVGAVIVQGEEVIGEGFHARCGSGHAEVRAMASVSDRTRIPGSTVYVTLEPCAHYGKTPPCAEMLVRERVGRVVVGIVDPFSKVSGRGIAMLRDAGIEVSVGVLEDECWWINRRFFTAHTHHRPYVTLKWACSSDGYMDHQRDGSLSAPMRFSTPVSGLAVMRLRAINDAIAVGSGTVLSDNPSLTVRNTSGHSPVRVVFDRRSRLSGKDYRIWNDDGVRVIHVTSRDSIADILAQLYQSGITSLLVEGGPTLLNAFIGSGLWDEVRREMSPAVFGESGTAPAPSLPSGIVMERRLDNNIITSVYSKRFAELLSRLAHNITPYSDF